MLVEERYNVPFDSSFDWRTTFVAAFRELASDSAIEVLKKIDSEEYEMPWGDMPDEMIKNAVRDNLFPKLIKAMESKAKKYADR